MNSESIPRFLEAKTAKSLEKKMLRNNISRQSFHQYQIVHDGKSFYAWYYVKLSGVYNQEMNEVLNGSADDTIR